MHFSAVFAVLFLFFSLVCSVRVHAYPVIIHASDHQELEGLRRNSVLAFTSDEKGGFSRIAVQIDELEFDQLMVIRNPTVSLPVREELHRPSDSDPFLGRLSRHHRLVFDSVGLGKCATANACSPVRVTAAVAGFCGSAGTRLASTLRVDLKVSGGTAFLGECVRPVQPLADRNVQFIEAERKIRGEKYEFVYSQESPFIMEGFRLLPSDPVMGRTFLAVTVRPQYFFSFTFDHENILSQLTAYNLGEVGVSGEMAISLRAAGITTSRSIAADMTAYRDAFYLPVVVDLPFSRSSLRPGSGFFYAFDYFGDPESEVETSLPYWPNERLSPATAGNYAVVSTKAGVVGIAIRSRGARFPQAYLVNKKGMISLGFSDLQANIGVFVDLASVDDSAARQRFDLWFYYGDKSEREIVTKYAAHGVEYALKWWR